tara:strand:+ start:2834 stop:3025 length:192 start_codon:yes stop_codon:yes gene_type:complete
LRGEVFLRKRTYPQHFKYFWKMGSLMFAAGIMFILKGVFPFIPIPEKLQLLTVAGKFYRWVNE